MKDRMGNMNDVSQKETQKFLYHYTNINSLALILKNQTIKFSCLETLNDLTEGLTSDYGEMGHYVFVSCWTDTSKDDIPLWNLYTPNMAGVRIRLPADPFKRYGDISIQGRTSGNFPNSIVPIGEIVGKNYLVFPTSYQLHKMNYTDDVALLKPKIIESGSDGKTLYKLKLLGRYKPVAWTFESEWRYIIWIVPSAPFDFTDRHYDDKMVDELKKVAVKKKLPFDHYFLSIRNDAFEQMEIILGPKHSEGDVAMVKALINTYNPKAQFALSALAGTIRK